jgi:HK97 gp10 family phage protein
MPLKVRGLKELNRVLERVPDRMAKRILRKAVREAAKPVLAEARMLARTRMQVRTGSLVRNITSRGATRNRHNTRGYVARQIIGVRHGQKGRKGIDENRGPGSKRVLASGRVKYTNDPFYYFFLEKGTKNIRARNFLRDALPAKRGAYINRFKTVVRQEILRGALTRKP